MANRATSRWTQAIAPLVEAKELVERRVQSNAFRPHDDPDRRPTALDLAMLRMAALGTPSF
jgi:hypothetical protein